MTDNRKPPRESWEGLKRTYPQGTAPDVPDADTTEEMVMRAVSGPGQALLDWLRAEFIEKRNRPGASEAELRELEAQRSLVSRIETMAKKGAQITAERAKKRAEAAK